MGFINQPITGEAPPCRPNCLVGAGSPKMSAQLERCVKLGPADAVSAGFKHSAALCGDGGLYLWGANNQGVATCGMILSDFLVDVFCK